MDRDSRGKRLLQGWLHAMALLAWLGLPAGAEIRFVDQAEQEVVLDAPVERAVTIPIPAASMFIAIDGGTSRLVGMNQLSKTAMEGFILGKFFPEALAISDGVAGEDFMPNVETLLGLDPDIVFQWGSWGEGIISPLRNAGLKVALFKYGTQEYLEGWIETFGTILGREEKARDIVAWHRETRRELEEKTAAIPENERPRVLYFLRYKSGLKVAGSETHNDVSIRLAGGKNAAGELKQFAEVNEEQVLLWNPEVILLNGFEKDVQPKDVYDNPRLADVSAVKKRRVYKMPLGGYRWDPPNQETPLMWKWMAMMLHPERLQWDLPKELTERYAFLYGKTPDGEDLDHIFQVAMNRNSAHYDRFASHGRSPASNP